MSIKYGLMAIFIGCGFVLQAKVWEVGQAKPYELPSKIVNIVNDGDTIFIYPGLYENDACKWTKSRLKFIGIGAEEYRPVIRYNGNIPNNKGIWVFEIPGYSDDIYIENIIFDGAKVSDNSGNNGAGIRFQANNLTVVNCLFRNCQNGILEGHGAVKNSTVIIRDSEFFNNGYSGYEHHIYINASTEKLIVENCFFHHPRGEANSIKTRAQNAYILYNYIDEEDGNGSYEINIAQGGNNIILGNVIVQGLKGANHSIVGYDDAINPLKDFYFIHNTVINKFSGNVRYFNISPKNGIEIFKVYNNVFATVPTASTQFISGNVPSSLDTAANYFVQDYRLAGFKNAEAGDYNLTESATGMIDKAVLLGNDRFGFNLTPKFMYQGLFLPLKERKMYGNKTDIGAFEFERITSVEHINRVELLYPNPNMGMFYWKTDVFPLENIQIQNLWGENVPFDIDYIDRWTYKIDLTQPIPSVYLVCGVSGQRKICSKVLIIK